MNSYRRVASLLWTAAGALLFACSSGSTRESDTTNPAATVTVASASPAPTVLNTATTTSIASATSTSAAVEFTDVVCPTSAGSCISAITFRERTYVVQCGLPLDPQAIERDPLAQGVWSKQPTVLHRIQGIDATVAIAVRSPGTGCASPGTWLTGLDERALSSGWSRWLSCSRGLVADDSPKCGPMPS